MAAVNKVDCPTLLAEATANGITSGSVTFTITTGTGKVGDAATAAVTGIPVANAVPNLVPGVPDTVGASATMRLEQAFTPPGSCAL
jgi:hypothetical protein